jgi:hypothetical protein
MANSVIYTPFFVRKAKTYKKKHVSLTSDLEELEASLIENPRMGEDLGAGLYKVRLQVKSKGKGKSGGYRIITYLLNQSNNDIVINMLTLYDKSEEESISKQDLLKLVRALL